MFALPIIDFSMKARTGGLQWFTPRCRDISGLVELDDRRGRVPAYARFI
jgi:hypothetical protein